MAILTHVYIVVAFLVASSLQSTTEYLACEDGPAPIDLRINGCTKFPCPMYKGSNLTAQWDFAVTADTDTLTPRIRATAMGITINYPFPEQDACKSLTNGECPLNEGEEVTYDLNMPISVAYPSIPLDIEFGLVGDDEKPQVCFKIKAKVVAAATKMAPRPALH